MPSCTSNLICAEPKTCKSVLKCGNAVNAFCMSCCFTGFGVHFWLPHVMWPHHRGVFFWLLFAWAQTLCLIHRSNNEIVLFKKCLAVEAETYGFLSGYNLRAQ